MRGEPRPSSGCPTMYRKSARARLWSSDGEETFVPERRIGIPETVDVVWVSLGPRALRYSASDGWREF